MLKKFKELLLKIPFKVLIGIVLIGSLIIIIDKIKFDFSFLNQFKLESFEVVNALSNDLKMLYSNLKVLFYFIYLGSMILIPLKIYCKSEKIKVMIVNSLGNTKVNILTQYLQEDTSFPHTTSSHSIC